VWFWSRAPLNSNWKVQPKYHHLRLGGRIKRTAGRVDAKPSAAANAWSGGAPRRGRGEARAPTQPELFGIGSEVLQCEFWALAHKGDGVLIDDFVDVGFCIPAAAHLESCLRNR